MSISTSQPQARNDNLPAYAIFAAMLSAAGLPIYIHAPKYFVDEYGVSLVALGSVLFALRLLDVVQDPLFGRWSGRLGIDGARRFYRLFDYGTWDAWPVCYCAKVATVDVVCVDVNVGVFGVFVPNHKLLCARGRQGICPWSLRPFETGAVA